MNRPVSTKVSLVTASGDSVEMAAPASWLRRVIFPLIMMIVPIVPTISSQAKVCRFLMQPTWCRTTRGSTVKEYERDNQGRMVLIQHRGRPE